MFKLNRFFTSKYDDNGWMIKYPKKRYKFVKQNTTLGFPEWFSYQGACALIDDISRSDIIYDWKYESYLMSIVESISTAVSDQNLIPEVQINTFEDELYYILLNGYAIFIPENYLDIVPYKSMCGTRMLNYICENETSLPDINEYWDDVISCITNMTLGGIVFTHRLAGKFENSKRYKHAMEFDSSIPRANINIDRFYDIDANKFDVDAFMHVVKIMHIALCAQSKEPDHNTSLGITNFATFLVKLGVKYQDQIAASIAAMLASAMSAKCFETSTELAEQLYGTIDVYREDDINRVQGIYGNHVVQTAMKIDLEDDNSLLHTKINNTKFSSIFGERVLINISDTWKRTLLYGSSYGFYSSSVTGQNPSALGDCILNCDSSGFDPFTHTCRNIMIESSYGGTVVVSSEFPTAAFASANGMTVPTVFHGDIMNGDITYLMSYIKPFYTGDVYITLNFLEKPDLDEVRRVMKWVRSTALDSVRFKVYLTGQHDIITEPSRYNISSHTPEEIERFGMRTKFDVE